MATKKRKIDRKIDDFFNLQPKSNSTQDVPPSNQLHSQSGKVTVLPSVGDMAKKTSQVSTDQTEANSGISTTICFSKDSTQDVPPSNQLYSQSAKVTVNIVKKSLQV
ncbi:uncharacterized protein LOC132735095 isoform X2 [Ruditapes philippinarum]|uniref:uncharacterized protein LOC132735095 isoform X2 n=1 Tax=Ruditapes philippinarum TaxID=129788 RepID=UPI00295BE8A0|nr:uncharacterized protein LOC132735095 isoform X2 [Ruditapes philippinarum]